MSPDRKGLTPLPTRGDPKVPPKNAVGGQGAFLPRPMRTNVNPDRPAADETADSGIVTGELPSELFRTSRGSGNIGHLDRDCKALQKAHNIRTIPTEYLRRADGRLCSECGDGMEL